MRHSIPVLLSCFLLAIRGLSTTLTGVAYDSQNANSTLVINKWIGLNMPILEFYDNFCGYWAFSQLLPQWNEAVVPMFTFQPEQLNCGTDNGNTAEVIASGAADSYLEGFLNQTKTFLAGPNGVYGDGDDRRRFMRFAHEMNGNWYPWCGNASAYVAMWQRFWSMSSKMGIDNTRMQWVWCPNANDVGGVTAESYYPGDDYVDWVAVDGYNDAKADSWSNWQQPNDVFGDMFSRIAVLAPNKPLGIAETGCSTSGFTAQNKSQWITDLFGYALQQNVKFVLWFNIEYIYADYAVFGSRNGTDTYVSPIDGNTYLVYDSFASAVQSVTVPLDPTNPRIISDEQFAGQFS